MSDAAPRLTLRLLGAPEVQSGGMPLALNHQKAWALLFYLAATGQPHTRDHLTALLWSESPTRDARHSLRSTLYRLRQALRLSGADRVLVENGNQLCLHLGGGDECDLARFRQLLSEGSERAVTTAAAGASCPPRASPPVRRSASITSSKANCERSLTSRPPRKRKRCFKRP